LAKQKEGSFQPSPRSYPQMMKKNETHGILFAGWLECIAYNHCNSTFFSDMYILDLSNPSLINWIKVQYNGNVVPPPRATACVTYDPVTDAVYLYGGVSYTAAFTDFIFFGDSWVFHFSTRSWTQLDVLAPPGTRDGMGCDLRNGNVYVTHGVTLGSIFFNDTWMWNVASNTWSLLPTSLSRPIGRFQMEFNRIPNSHLFLFANGQLTPSPTQTAFLTDVWTFDSNSLIWTQFEVTNVPLPARAAAAYALTSSKYLFMMGGDDYLSNTTVDDTCPEPLDCVVRLKPTDDTFILRLKLNQETANWQPSDFTLNIPPNRKGGTMIIEPYVIFTGGLGWDGKNAVGEIYNEYTWILELSSQYFS